MKVLFIRSGNSGDDPISTRQGESLEKAGLNVSFYDIIGKGLRGYLRNISLIRKAVREFGADLLHAHYGLSGILASLSLTGKPVVTSLMGSDVLRSGLIPVFLIRIFSKYFWIATIVKTAEMKTKTGLKDVLVIPNGVDMEIFFPGDRDRSLKRLGWEKSEKHILFASDPARPEKNYALAQKAFSLVAGEYLKEPVRMHFLSGINRDEVADYYRASDVLLLTSLHEGSPNSVKESMACNCPVVSTDVGDVREIISDAEGNFITSFDPADVAKKTVQVLDSGKRTDGRGKIAHLDSRVTARRIVEVYETVLNKRTT